MIGRQYFFLSSLAIYSIFSGFVYGISTNGPLYTSIILDNNAIYAVDRQNGAYTQVAICPGPLGGITDFSLLNSTTAYALNGGDSNVYSINLQTGAGKLVTSTPLLNNDLFAITVANSSTAYVVDYGSQDIYSIDLQTGAHSLFTTLPGTPGPTDIVVGNNSTAYVVGYNDNNIYAINLQTGASQIVTASPVGSPSSPGLQGITLANNTTAYVSGAFGGDIYRVDLATGTSTLVSSFSGSSLENVAVDHTTVYSVNNIGGQVYAVNLSNGSSYILADITAANATGLVGAALLLQMGGPRLSGNNLKVANYLNANAPLQTIRLLALLTDSELPPALMSVAPTRNAFSTFASQNAFLAASQTVADHGRQKRYHRQLPSETNIALLADNSDTISYFSCAEKSQTTIWIAPFGEYVHQSKQNQAPVFNIGLGGVVAAIEWTGEENNAIGLGGTYVYSKVNEEKNTGSANINQGFVTLYGTVNADRWYFDLGVWGGYYHSGNQRNIAFPGIDTVASSSINGWQLAPHFETGYDGFWMTNCNVSRFGIEPFVMTDWVANWERGFKETGAGSLNMGQKSRFCSLIRAEGGLRFHEIVQFDWGRLVFREKASYAYQQAFGTGRLTAYLVGSPGNFVVETLTAVQNLGVVEFSMLFISRNTKVPYLDLRFQDEFGSQYQSYQGVIEIGKTF